ncbi:DUF2254 domain-containing protein [Polyangium spumosum]|nr:DUF2254 domain-containing protein [Polyangium spumosum]
MQRPHASMVPTPGAATARSMLRRLSVHLRTALQDVRSSLWFVPTVLVVASMGLAFGLVEAQFGVGEALEDIYPRFFETSPDDARQLLSAIATSVLTVAGVTFSITAVTLSLVASQYTPRVVRSFMRSRKTQVALGVLMGVYVYALVVLRTVSGSPSPYVPNLAVIFAFVYVVAGIFVFIVFVHHIAAFIQPATIASDVYDETIRAMRETFPEELGDCAPEDTREAEVERAVAELAWHPLPAPEAGYIQAVDLGVLIRHAARARTIVRLGGRVGEFMIEGAPLLFVAHAPPDAASARRLLSAVHFGAHRTIEEDPTYGVRLLVDMALKGLSPGIHDPTTAMMCIDHLAALLLHAARRKIVQAHRGEDGAICAIVPRTRFEELLSDTIEPICLAAREQPQVLERLVVMLGAIGRELGPGSRRFAVRSQVAMVADQVSRLVPVPGRSRVMGVAARVREELDVMADVEPARP